MEKLNQEIHFHKLILIYLNLKLKSYQESRVYRVILLFLLIGTNLRRRIKLITFDFNKNKVKLEPIKFSFIGTKTATISPPFNVKIRRNTREKQHTSSDGDGYAERWTTYHEGYEVMVNLEKLGYQSVMFLETDNLKQDYGDLISRLVTFAGIDDPLLEIDEN